MARFRPILGFTDKNDGSSLIKKRKSSLDTILHTVNFPRTEATISALKYSTAEFHAGNLSAAISGLGYALRLAPDDERIRLALGLLKFSLRDVSAIQCFEDVARKTHLREHEVVLASALLTVGKADRSAEVLAKSLSTNAPGCDKETLALAQNICETVGAQGWCGLDNFGCLSVGGSAARLPKQINITLDGRDVKIGRIKYTEVHNLLRIFLKNNWQTGQMLTVSVNQIPLMGSPISIESVTRVEGIASIYDGGIMGWCWLPGQPELAPKIKLREKGGYASNIETIAKTIIGGLAQFPEFCLPRQYIFSAETVRDMTQSVDVLGPHDRKLMGSPVVVQGSATNVCLAIEIVKNLFPVYQSQSPKASNVPKPFGIEPIIRASITPKQISRAQSDLPRSVDIIIPVFRGLQTTRACINSVRMKGSLNQRIIVVFDGSNDQELLSWLIELSDSEIIHLEIHDENRGYPAAVNTGLKLNKGSDVVLLNNDTQVPPGWLNRLQDAVYSQSSVGTATPLSNDATIFSYPLNYTTNPPLDFASMLEMDKFVSAANANTVIDVPTGHGFCMYIRLECLIETGGMREDIFAQGYGEENDFCMRATANGWRHIATPNVYVCHLGHQSFSIGRENLVARNLEILNRLYVGYDQLIADWCRNDPLFNSRRKIDLLRFKTYLGDRRSILLVTHDRKGGVAKHVKNRAEKHGVDHECVLILRPKVFGCGAQGCIISVSADDSFVNLCFRFDIEVVSLLNFLQSAHIRLVEIHHFVGLNQRIFTVIQRLACIYDVWIHDYSWFCPRITLTTTSKGYCGEPSVKECGYCVSDNGSLLDEDIGPVQLIARTMDLFVGARAVVAPSFDTAQRMMRHFRFDVTVATWESEVPKENAARPIVSNGTRRVCIVGAIGYEKGFDILLTCARLASDNNLPIKFCLVGYSCDDQRLLKTGKVQITGPYTDSEVGELISAQDCDFAFFPSIWPETWSYVLTEIWRAGLRCIAFDLGAQAERIRANGRGVVLPLHIKPLQLMQFFLKSDPFEALAR